MLLSLKHLPFWKLSVKATYLLFSNFYPCLSSHTSPTPTPPSLSWLDFKTQRNISLYGGKLTFCALSLSLKGMTSNLGADIFTFNATYIFTFNATDTYIYLCSMQMKYLCSMQLIYLHSMQLIYLCSVQLIYLCSMQPIGIFTFNATEIFN